MCRIAQVIVQPLEAMMSTGSPVLPSRSSFLVRGLLFLVVGVICVVWPGISVGVIVALIAIVCFADALLLLIDFFRHEPLLNRVLSGVLIVINLAVGIVVVVHPHFAAKTLAVILGIWALVYGVGEIVSAVRHRGDPEVAGVGFAGVLATAFGICLIVWPDIGAKTIGVLIGLWLAFTGVLLLFLAWQRDRLEALAQESEAEPMAVEEKMDPLSP